MCCRDDLKYDIDGSFMNFPSISLSDTPEDTLENFFKMRADTIAKGVKGEGNKFACQHCKEWVKADWEFNSFITYVNMSFYPSPCQAHCCYCGLNGNLTNTTSTRVDESYKKLFDCLDIAKKYKLIEPTGIAFWQVSCGEITIHPYKKRIMQLVKGARTCYFTNGFIFDEDIARELHDNPLASINISIDAGTPETWYKVKGVNNFAKVLENLAKYSDSASTKEKITFKYIVMPDINDSNEDFLALTYIMKFFGINKLNIARDFSVSYAISNRVAYNSEKFIDKKLIASVARLIEICQIKGLDFVLSSLYTHEERLATKNLADKLLQAFLNR